MSRSRLVLAVLVAACASASGGSRPAPPAATAPQNAPAAASLAAAPAGPSEAVAAQARQLDADTELKSASGATFTVSKGWFVTESAGYTLLEDPDRELKLVLMELPAASADEAIAAGWKRFQPDFARKPFQTVRPPAIAPWEEVAQTMYDVPAVETRAIIGAARRAGATWYVALIDGTTAALGRRGAQVNVTVNGLKPAGAHEESLAGRTPKQLDAAAQAELDRFVREAMPVAQVPGAAVVVVQDGRVVFARGYGVREAGRRDPVTPDTMFLIGSVTKSLTTLMMAKLVDEGRFGWDTKVRALRPTFALGDPAATEQLAMKHTVCACTGLPRQDMEFLFEWANVTPEDRLRQMSAMKPTTGFGETFQYSNTMVSSGGYIAASAAAPDGDLERTYERVIAERVFRPLGMTRTTFDFEAALKADHATPHGLDLTLAPRPIPPRWELAVRSVAPAGGAWSSARDLARWVALELAKGVGPDGKRIVSEQNLLARRQPMARIGDKSYYGLGLMVGDDRGLQVVGHGGNTLGMSASVFWFPEANLGGVVLTNAQGANAFAGAVSGRLVELVFDAKPRAAQAFAFAMKTRADSVEKARERLEETPDPAWMRALAGRWHEPALGDLELREEAGAWVLDAGEWTARVGRYRDVNGELSLALLTPPFVELTFTPREENGRQVLVLDAGQQRYAFERVGEVKPATLR